MTDFWAMGGYGAFVWSAYAVSFGALILLFALSWLASRRREAELERWRKRLEALDEQ